MTDAAGSAEAGQAGSAGQAVQRLHAVIAQLREHCPWMRQLTHESLVNYLIEEAYEAAESIETGERGQELAGELGDVLLQMVLHAQISAEHGGFDLAEVAEHLRAKMIRRNPHVFDAEGNLRETFPATVEQIEETWHQVKATEQLAQAVFEGIPLALPALQRAQKVLSRAERALATVPVAPSEGGLSADELGEQILALLAANPHLDAEQAVRSALRKIESEVSGGTAESATAESNAAESEAGKSGARAGSPEFDVGRVRFSRAQAQHVAGIAALIEADPVSRSRGQWPVADYQRGFAALDRDANQLLMVGTRDGKVVATFTLSFLAALGRGGMLRAQLESVHVAAALQGSGVGTAMITWAIAEAKRRGAGVVQLTSSRSRTRAHQFYERLGFEASHVGMKLVFARQ